MFKADKVNHMEMVNHPAMTEIFNDIFDLNNEDVPEFFKVSPKDQYFGNISRIATTENQVFREAKCI